jgi:hypothetical protein
MFKESYEKFITDSARVTALVDATVIDGTGSPSKKHQTIVIEDGVITKLGTTEVVKPPAGATVINCSGKTVIPGMVMLHEHLYYTMEMGPYFNLAEMPYSFPRMYLAGGATTIRTAGSIEPQTDLAIKRLIGEGRYLGPDIDVTAPYIERKGWDIPTMFEIKDSSEATSMVNFWADRGCTNFKMYTHATIEDLEHGFLASADFDHERKGHEFNVRRESKALENLDLNSPEMKSLINLLVSKKVALTSTLPVFAPYTNAEVILGGGDSVLLPEAYKLVKDRRTWYQHKDSDDAVLFKKELVWEKQFYDAGGLLVCGTDPTGSGNVLPGYSSRTELEFLVAGGFSVVQAIRIATLNGAKYHSFLKISIFGAVPIA